MFAQLLHRSQLYRFLQAKRGRTPAVSGPVYLSHRRVYILPTRAGLAFAVSLLLMLIGSINYQLSLGYMMTFLLAGTATVAMLHTYRNLVHVRIEAGKVEDAFAGDEAYFHLHLHNPGHYERIALEVVGGRRIVHCDVPPRDSTEVRIALPSERRGWLALPRLVVRTQYPLGLYSAWSYAHLDMRALIYPRPDRSQLPPPEIAATPGSAAQSGPGSDDFHGLRGYHAGDSLRHIAWKAAAHSDTLLTKLFTGHGAAELWLDYDALPAGMDREARLSRLTRGVLLAAEAGANYGLRLPHRISEAAAGEAHRDECLRALALHELQ